MSGIDDRNASMDGPRVPKARLHSFRHVALQFSLGVIGVALITFATVVFHVVQLPSRGIGPGTISLLYLIVIVFVSHRGGFVSSVAVSLIAVLCLNYFVLPLVPSLEAKNPLDIVATVAFLLTAWTITGIEARVRQLTQAQLTLQFQASKRLMELQETERRHLARELHDEIGQLLTGLHLLLGPNGESPDGTLKTRFEQARTIVDDLVAKVRTMSFDLRPVDLDMLGLLPALLTLFERYTAQTRVVLNFRHHGLQGRFASEVETGAYRVVQEALTNVARHAGVSATTVSVWTEVDKLNLQIEDRGCGFDPEVVLKTPRSSGLIGMRERVMLLGGRMIIESSPGSGTTVIAELPLDETTAT